MEESKNILCPACLSLAPSRDGILNDHTYPRLYPVRGLCYGSGRKASDPVGQDFIDLLRSTAGAQDWLSLVLDVRRQRSLHMLGASQRAEKPRNPPLVHEADRTLLTRQNSYTKATVRLDYCPAEVEWGCQYVVVCEKHGDCHAFPTKALAMSALDTPWEWCEKCPDPR